MIVTMTLTDGTMVDVRCGREQQFGPGMRAEDATAAAILTEMENDAECAFETVEDIDRFVQMFASGGVDIELLGALEGVP